MILSKIKVLRNSSFIINQWYGRFGNNVLQVANCITLAEMFEGWARSPLQHPLLKNFDIRFSLETRNTVSEKFFCDDDGSDLLEGYVLDVTQKQIWQSLLVKNISHVLENILSVKMRKDPIDDRILVVHLRGEDIFNSHAPIYTQNPLSHVVNIINDFEEVWVVHQDEANPIVNEIKKNCGNKCKFFRGSPIEDFEILYRSKNLLLGGCSTFSEVAALGSPHKKKVWTSDACRFVDHIKINNDVVHLKLDEKYCGGRRNWNADLNQMMTYEVTDEDYTSHTK